MDWDERHIMTEEGRRASTDIVRNPFYIPLPGECQCCGSLNTFKTFDKKLVCRNCWKVVE